MILVIFAELHTDRLVERALIRVRGLREVRETLSRGEAGAAEVERCLEVAGHAIARLGRPEACFTQIEATPFKGGARLGNGLEITDEVLAKRYGKDGQFFVYLLSLGYDTGAMMKELNGDYALYHFHYYIARTLLLLIGKELHELAEASHPRTSLVRIPVRLEGEEVLQELPEPEETGKEPARRNWDPAKVARLLPFLEGCRTRLEVTQAGCLKPLFSIVGLMVGTPHIDDDGMDA